MKKPIIYIIVLIVIILLGIGLAVKITKDFRVKPASSNNVINNSKDNDKNNIEDGINTNINEVEINNTIDNSEAEKPKTDFEKAIDIVKEDWGNDSSVYYAQDGKTVKGEIIICVRDKNSTAALAWYTVNIEDETFTRE